MRAERRRVQRTLILTQGELADIAGEQFRRLMIKREGPHEAIAVVSVAEEREKTTAMIQKALSRISPSALGALLADQGWQLDPAQEIHLILLLDLNAAPEATTLCRDAAQITRRHLGVETVAMPIWLASDEDPDAAAIAGMLSPDDHPLLFPRGVIALSLLNEAGLRLPSTDALAAAAAELLWAFIATPLRHIPEQQTATYAPEETGALMTAGVGGWRWSPPATLTRLQERWLQEVIDAWLAEAAAPATVEEAAGWLSQHKLTAHHLAEQALPAKEQHLPDFPPAAWRAPLPWEIADLMQQWHSIDEGDRARQREREEGAALYLERPLLAGREAMASYLESLLDAHPVGGVAAAQAWTAAARRALQEAFADLGAQEAARVREDAALGEERGLIRAQWRELVAEWPGSDWREWIRLAWRGWRWPGLIWRYWKLRRLGQQLTFVLRRQATRRRQRAATAAAAGALLELVSIARHWQSHAEEIGDMLRHVGRKLETNKEDDDVPLDDDGGVSAFPLAQYVAGEELFSQVVPDVAAEAEAAAAATGGLGQHLRALDDAALAPLQEWGRARLQERLDGYTAVSVITAQDATTLHAYWRQAWENAAPLWRYDEARLPEGQRTETYSQAFVCGTGLMELRDQEPLSFAASLQWISSPDRERVLALRLRGGLTVEAMAR